MSMTGTTRYTTGIAVASASVLLLAACASSKTSNSAGGDNNASGASHSASTSGLKTESTSIGTVAADSSGHTLYELVGNTTTSNKCTGGCLAIWPAAMINGTQVVLQGHPAFTFAEDSAPGQTHGQGAKDQWGTWYALDKNGAPITSSAAAGGSSSSSGSSSGSGGGGGYGY